MWSDRGGGGRRLPRPLQVTSIPVAAIGLGSFLGRVGGDAEARIGGTPPRGLLSSVGRQAAVSAAASASRSATVVAASVVDCPRVTLGPGISGKWPSNGQWTASQRGAPSGAAAAGARLPLLDARCILSVLFVFLIIRGAPPAHHSDLAPSEAVRALGSFFNG